MTELTDLEMLSRLVRPYKEFGENRIYLRHGGKILKAVERLVSEQVSKLTVTPVCSNKFGYARSEYIIFGVEFIFDSRF